MAERNKLTLDDLGFLLEELTVVCGQWYYLGLQLKVNVGALDTIREQSHDPINLLLEMLKAWLTSSDNTSWKTLIDALRSRSVGKSQLAADLQKKYCLVEETEVDEMTQMSASRETKQLPLSLQEEPQMRNKLALNDLGLLLEELVDVDTQWYYLGLQLKVRPETLDKIREALLYSRDKLLELLKAWLTDSDNTSWKTLIDALKSRSVGKSQLAADLQKKYCLVEETEVDEMTQMSASRETKQLPLSLQEEPQMRNKLTLDDLGLLLEELMDLDAQWVDYFGVQLGLKTMTLQRITLQRITFEPHDPRDRLLEILKAWLTTSDNTSWKSLTYALMRMGESRLAGSLERKYHLTKDMREKNILTMDDLDLLLEELVEVCGRWYPLGLQLKVSIVMLDRIREQFPDSRGRFLEMLKTWLATSDNTSWKTLVDAVKSRSVDASRMADYLESKYCPLKDMRETAQSPPGIIVLSQDDSTPLGTTEIPDASGSSPAAKKRKVDASNSETEALPVVSESAVEDKGLDRDDKTEAQMSPSRETQPTPFSLQEETQMSEDPAIPLSLKQVLKDTEEVTDWYFLGIHLDIPTSVLKQIERDCKDTVRSKIEVIDLWLDNDPEPTWNKLAQAVEDMGGHPKVVETLRANHEGVLLISEVPVTSQDEDKSVAQISVLTEIQPTPTSLQGESQMMTKQAQGQVRYQTVKLLKTELLGAGSYGAVYKAMCDDLPCAGKILHPTLFQSNDPGTMTIMKQFLQECSVLSALRHPSIVQYLGSYEDPETKLPVLLMELMDDNLTRFLERSKESLPYHTQVNICHDIVLALAYLHSNDIIHRDLSSNNVLMTGAGNRAKVTDFGMAKFFNINRATMTPLTKCPGTLAYMSPEAFDDPPVYTKKLDTFSFGVLGIQIVTQQFPDPGPRVKKVQDHRDPKRKLHEVVPETERRKSHIDLINSTHPLLPMAIDCLTDNEEKRPSAQELCHQLAVLKETSQYGDSVQQAEERSRAATADKEDRERQLREQQTQIQDLQQELQVRDAQVKEKDAVIATREQQILQLEQVTQEKDHEIEARERQLRELNQKLTESEQLTAHLQQTLQQRENMIQELQEEKQHLRLELAEVSQQQIVTKKDYLRGMDVIAEASVLITNQTHSFHWAGYGLKLHVPQGALPAGLEECRVLIKVGISGHFALPQNTSLVSAVYWLDSEPRCKFSQPLTLEIQHCAMASQTSRLSFALAKCSQKSLPYTFEILDGGEFSSLSAYGCIQLQHFSFVTVLMRLIMGENNVKYCASLYYLRKGMNQREIHFVITKDQEAHVTAVQQEYTSKSATKGPDAPVKFESETIALRLPSEEEILEGGWRIISLFPPVITKEAVDSYKPKQRIPSCQLRAEWTEQSQPLQLTHQVILEGAKEPYNYFRIVLDSIPSAGVHSKYPDGLGSKPELSDLMNEIAAKIPGKWRDVGLQLGLDQGVLDGISLISPGDTNHCYSNVFTRWKNQDSTTHPYTWSTVVQALESRTVGENLLASKIKNELTGHPHQ